GLAVLEKVDRRERLAVRRRHGLAGGVVRRALAHVERAGAADLFVEDGGIPISIEMGRVEEVNERGARLVGVVGDLNLEAILVQRSVVYGDDRSLRDAACPHT